MVSTSAVMCPHCGAPPAVALRAAPVPAWDEPVALAIRATLRLPNDAALDLAALAKVESLKLDEVFEGDLAGLADALARLPALKMLGLSRCGLVDVEPLARLKGLRYLYLEGNRISDVSPLCAMKSLRQLWLYGNPLSKEEAARAEQALPGCEVFY